MKKTMIATLLGSLLLAGGIAQAKEGGDQYPNGAENWFAGAVPPPGNYFINYTGYWGGKLKDGNGDTILPGGAPVKLEATFDALRYLKVTEHKILGGNWGWHVIVPVVNLEIGTAAGKSSRTSVGDITINPFIVSWHHSPEWHTVVGLDINLPTGAYNANGTRPNIGANYYSFEPIFGFSYLGSNGWEVSAKLMYNIKTKNNDTDYRSGDEFHMDYLVGKNIGNWGIGVSGYYLKQLTDDKVGGAKIGNRGQVFSYGPSIKYRTKGGTHFIGYWQHETKVENRFGGDKFWLKLIMPL